jgi:predicted nucleic acid-binding protein
MNSFLLDASALVKRYSPERGAPLVHHLFVRAARHRLRCLMLGAAEVVAALVRKRNGGRLTPPLFTVAMAELRAEVVMAADFQKLPADNPLINASLLLLEKYPINSSDAVVLQTALDLAPSLRLAGDDLVLVASDRRLLASARAERLLTFDPETQSQADLDALIGP